MSQSTTSHDEDTGATAKAEAATHEASATAKAAGEAAQGVAQTGAHEAAAVADEAKARIGDLLAQSGREVSDQAATQQRRLAEGLGSVGSDLSRMAEADESGGIAGELVRRAAGHASTIGSWLEDRDPQQLVRDVTAFARRRPGTFIAVAAIAGVVVGRLSRAIAAGAASGSTSTGSNGPAQLGGPRFAEADAAARGADEGGSGGSPVAGPGLVASAYDDVSGSAPDGVVGSAGATGTGVDDTGLVDDTVLVDDTGPRDEGADPPLFTESAARLDSSREGGSHDRPDTV